ncbi:MAG: hypothetical protein HKN94_01720, partial [Acidimicrobiales bacterium]|nr:hypothetical protein [Acidimicrobiales bacterium]
MTDSGPEAAGFSTFTRRLFLVGVCVPLTGTSIGIDGGEIFQILAIENLDLDPRAIGIALGLGTLSVPVQIWAARIPLERARTNLRIFLGLLGAMALLTAGLVRFAEPGTTIAALALVVAILAEIGVSVLFATSWQPLLSYVLTSPQRQIINGQGRATTGVALLVSVVLFGQLGQTGRALFLFALAVFVWWVSWLLRVLPAPEGSSAGVDAHLAKDAADESRKSAGLRNIYLALPASALAGWPLLLTYIALVLWPTANLGLVGAALAFGGIGAASLWRDPGEHLLDVIRIGAVATAACSIAIALFAGPITSNAAGALLLGIIVVGTAARTTMRAGIMELAHRRIDSSNAVRVMTMFDVIGSTSFQIGFFIVGFLIAASVDTTASVNPFQLWLWATA